MSQHDYVLDNAAGAAFRADVNAALGAIATQNKGPTAPATTYPGMPWFDETTGLQKYRNDANTAWVLDSLSAASRGSIAMHATTMDLWALPQIIDGTGSPVTITAIANAPHPSARRTLYPIAGTVITNGATFAVDGAANYTTAAGDAIEFEAVTTSTYKVHITKKDGTAIVGTGLSAAAQADMEAATSTTVAVTPGRQKFHPATPKYIGLVNGATGAITNIYSSSGTPTCTRTGTGTYSIASMALSTGGAPFLQSLDADRVATPSGITGNGFNVTTRTPGGANADVSFYFCYYGDLP